MERKLKYAVTNDQHHSEASLGIIGIRDTEVKIIRIRDIAKRYIGVLDVNFIHKIS